MLYSCLLCSFVPSLSAYQYVLRSWARHWLRRSRVLKISAMTTLDGKSMFKTQLKVCVACNGRTSRSLNCKYWNHWLATCLESLAKQLSERNRNTESERTREFIVARMK